MMYKLKMMSNVEAPGCTLSSPMAKPKMKPYQQAKNAGKLQQLEKALLHLNTLRTVIQWIPSHCDVEGNEKADSLAKTGVEEEQENNPVSLKEMNTIIKSNFKPSKKQDAYI